MESKKVKKTKQRFSEPQLYLLKNWASARMLEQSMEKVREEYAQVFNKVLDAVEEEHEELENRAIHTAKYDGHVGIAKQSWPCLDANWPSGLWIGNIALENLVSEDENAPEAYVRAGPSKEGQMDMKRAESRLREGAEKILGRKQMKDVWIAGKKTLYLWYKLTEPRQELLELLVSANGNGFVDRMIGHFEGLARFIPVLDEIFGNGKARRK